MREDAGETAAKMDEGKKTRVLPVVLHAVLPARLFSIHSTAVWSTKASI